MFHSRYRKYIQSFLLVLPMTGLVTVINTLVARGIQSVLTIGTLKRWSISLVIAFPAVLFMAPLAAKLTNAVIKKDE